MPSPAPTAIWSWDSGVRNVIVTDVEAEAAVTATALTSPLGEVVVLPPPGGRVTPEIEKTNSVEETKCASDIRLLKSETWLSIVKSTPVG